jgi:putative transposase
VKYAFIDDSRSAYGVTELCSVMKVSRRGYYDWVTRPDSSRALENQQLLSEIEKIFHAHKEVYGAPRIYRELIAKGFFCSLNRVARLMRNANIVPKTIRKFCITTDSRNSLSPAHNILAQDFTTQRCNEKWVADVTYIPTREGWLFLAVVLDLCSRKVVGWSMGERLTSGLAQQALRNALKQRGDVAGLLHHSDRGREYYAGEYQTLLSDNGITSSMSRKGNCYDNAVMESFFHSLKVEQVHHDVYKTRSQARSTLFEYIEIFYNRVRRHSSINYLSPMDYEAQLA